jgi:hypothetical protein
MASLARVQAMSRRAQYYPRHVSHVEVTVREREDDIGRGPDYYTVRFAIVRPNGDRENVYRTEFRRPTRESAFKEADDLLATYKASHTPQGVTRNTRVDRRFISAAGTPYRRQNGW